MQVDGFSLGYSDDGGATFHKLMTFREIQGPLTCREVQAACAAHWERIQTVLGIGSGGSDAGVSGGGSGGGSHCASAGGDAWAPWILVAFLSRASGKRRKRT
jgi:hypothetical protein